MLTTQCQLASLSMWDRRVSHQLIRNILLKRTKERPLRSTERQHL